MCLRFDARLEKQEFEQIAELFGPINNPIARTKAGDWYQYSNRRQAIDAGYVFTDEDREKSGEATFDLLDATTREEIAGQNVLYAYNNDNAFPPRRAASGEAYKLIEVTHPLVRTHPVAGSKALFIDLDRAKQIVELDTLKGRSLLQELQDHAEANALKGQHDWHECDVLVWDNASVQHKAEGNFKVGEQRRFWRHMVAGPCPA